MSVEPVPENKIRRTWSCIFCTRGQLSRRTTSKPLTSNSGSYWIEYQSMHLWRERRIVSIWSIQILHQNKPNRIYSDAKIEHTLLFWISSNRSSLYPAYRFLLTRTHLEYTFSYCSRTGEGFALVTTSAISWPIWYASSHVRPVPNPHEFIK